MNSAPLVHEADHTLVSSAWDSALSVRQTQMRKGPHTPSQPLTLKSNIIFIFLALASNSL